MSETHRANDSLERRLDRVTNVMRLTAALAVVLSVAAGVFVKQMGLMTEPAHAEDVRVLERVDSALRSEVRADRARSERADERQELMLRCLIWEVPAEQCGDFANVPIPRPERSSR